MEMEVNGYLWMRGRRRKERSARVRCMIADVQSKLGGVAGWMIYDDMRWIMLVLRDGE